MSKTSENKKRKYAAHPAKIIPNKRRRITKHLKKQPNDQQSAAVLAKL